MKISEEVNLANKLFDELFPINRSITGDGVRKTLLKLSEIVALDINEVPCGTKCFDWIIPREWSVRSAWIRDKTGKTIVDFQRNNLHLVSYSKPVHKTLHYNELVDHLHYLPDKPEAISYRTSYYEDNWGFCMSYRDYLNLDKNAEYEVYIDSEFNEQGSLTYAQASKKGNSSKEYIISTYCCHPSMANDNLSGLILAVLLFHRICEIDTVHSYRLLIAPETIGVISFLAQQKEAAKKITGGYVVTTVAGPGSFGYKHSFLGDHEIDLAAKEALRKTDYISYPFEPVGSDERQYSTPGFRIPVGTICKDKYYEYDQYHTSLDNLNFISSQYLVETLEIYWETIMALEANCIYDRNEPHCEYQLSRYDLYLTTGGSQLHSVHQHRKHKEGESGIGIQREIKDLEVKAMNWLMYACDGKTPLLVIAQKSGISISILNEVCQRFINAKLLKKVVDQ